jgi:hypothetical protein
MGLHSQSIKVNNLDFDSLTFTLELASMNAVLMLLLLFAGVSSFVSASQCQSTFCCLQ